MAELQIILSEYGKYLEKEVGLCNARADHEQIINDLQFCLTILFHSNQDNVRLLNLVINNFEKGDYTKSTSFLENIQYPVNLGQDWDYSSKNNSYTKENLQEQGLCIFSEFLARLDFDGLAGIEEGVSRYGNLTYVLFDKNHPSRTSSY